MTATVLSPDDPDAAILLRAHELRKMGEDVIRNRVAILAHGFVANAVDLDHGPFIGALVQAAEELWGAMVADLGETEVTELAMQFFIEEAVAERHLLRPPRPD